MAAQWPKDCCEGKWPFFDTRAKCKYEGYCKLAGIAYEEAHTNKFVHPCFYMSEGTATIAPNTQMPRHVAAKHGEPKFAVCDNTDPEHRRRYWHAEDVPVVEEVVDMTIDEFDKMVISAPDEPISSSPAESATELSEEQMETAMAAKGSAMEAMSEGEFEKAVELFATALTANKSALVLANKANCHVRLKQPNAAVADCKAAISINPDSAKAYKVIGKAYCQLGLFSEAYSQLCTANKIDSDPDSFDLQQKLGAKVKKMKKNAELEAAAATNADPGTTEDKQAEPQ